MSREMLQWGVDPWFGHAAGLAEGLAPAFKRWQPL